jgi:hypothetical protein
MPVAAWKGAVLRATARTPLRRAIATVMLSRRWTAIPTRPPR